MERRFDMSDFEQSLKDHADQFKLIPSKRVWNGIYNDLHPGSKWPSITVGIIFLITLVTIGNLNNHSNKTVNKEKTSFLSSSKTELKSASETDKSNTVAEVNSPKENSTKLSVNNNSIEKTSNSESTNSGVSSIKNAENNTVKNNETESIKSSSVNDEPKAPTTIAIKSPINSEENFTLKNDNESSNERSAILNEAENLLPNVSGDQQISFNTETEEALPSIERISFDPRESNLSVSENSFLSVSENSLNNLIRNTNFIGQTNESILTNLKKALRKKNKNTEWIFYVSPNISTVSFDHKTIHPSISPNPSSIVVLPNQPNASVELMPNPRIGFETGAEIKTLVAKNLKVVSGFNINYSSYNTVSNIVHPTIATLILTNKEGTYTKDYITYYGNGQTQNHVSLTNYNVQFSIPVGFEYTIWGNKKVAINIQSVIEPSAVLASNAYLLSSDGRYYVNDPSLLRKINLGGNFGTFVSFSSNKIRWHIGPDIRYQFLSSYKNNYSGKEHFMDYGIRIGLSRVK